TAMILNNIFQGTPSVIQGQLQANGIVYLINQNGIVFDKGSQVNVGALVASALGLNSVNGQTFFDSASTFPTGQPVFSGYGSDPQNGKPAQIQLLGTINANPGGSVMVFAPRISVGSKGTVGPPDGQVILAAGQKVWLSTTGDATSMRGFVVEYQADPAAIPKTDPNNPAAPTYADASGVVNLGQVLADRGN